MLSMVLLVVLLCVEPAKATLLEPAKAALFLGLLQPAKARPPLPWWRVRVWENRYWLCSPDGYIRELDEDEEDEIEEIFDDNAPASKYVWQQSSDCVAGNCWSVSWNQPEYWWYDYVVPQVAGTADYYQHWEDWNAWQPAQGYNQPAHGYSNPGVYKGQPAQGYNERRCGWASSSSQPRSRARSVRPPERRPHKPEKAAPDSYQHMYRGQGARSKRTARRLLVCQCQTALSLERLPEPEKAEAKALQKRLKELRFSTQYSTRQVEWEVSQVKARLHELLGPASDVDEEDELEKATEVNKQLMEAIAMAKAMQESLAQSSQNCSLLAAQAEPAKAAPAKPEEAAPVEPALPTGDTEESSGDEWTKVKKDKKKKKLILKKKSMVETKRKKDSK